MSVAKTIADMLAKTTDRWAKQRKAEIRDANARFRRSDRMSRRFRPMKQTEAAEQLMHLAYLTASANGTLPANPRQIYYAARPEMLRLTELSSISSNYFTQTLLIAFMKANPRLTANWNIAWDDRGHFSEPHTSHEIGLGTLAVRGYIARLRAMEIRSAGISTTDVSTMGPSGRYGAVLFLEKEGFTQILEAARIAERYDIAIMSTKGMSVTAARILVEELCGRRKLPLFVLHDFDLAGFSIKKTLTESGERFQFRHQINFIDLGLRLTDVEELEAEAVHIRPLDPILAASGGRGNLRYLYWFKGRDLLERSAKARRAEEDVYRRVRSMAQFDFVIDESNIGEVIGPPTVSWLTSGGPSGRIRRTKSPITIQAGDSMDIACVASQDGGGWAAHFGDGQATLWQNASVGYRGDLMVLCVPKGSVWELTLSDVPFVYTPPPPRWAKSKQPAYGSERRG